MKITKKDLEKLIKEELSNATNDINEVEYGDDFDDFDSLKTETVARRLKQIVAELENLAERAEDPKIGEGVALAAKMTKSLLDVAKKKVVKRKVDPASIEKAKATRKANQTPDPEALDWVKQILNKRGIV